MINFSIRQEAKKNFRPASLIYQYAKAGQLETFDAYGSICLVLNGMVYGYSHYTIEDNNDGTETVTVYMALKEK